MLLEVVGNIHLDPNKTKVEHKWLGLLQVDKIQLSSRRPVISPFWQVRCSKKEFIDWWQSKNKVSIFFDGTSKRNPGNAGAGGLIFYLRGRIQTIFSWGLGQLSNNQAELYALLKACQLTKEAGHHNFQIFGDSEIIIKFLNLLQSSLISV